MTGSGAPGADPDTGSGSSEAPGFTGAAATGSPGSAAAARAAVEAARAQNARTVDPEVAGMEGAEAPPRRNGELVFDHLWEGRTFGMAVTLSDQGIYPWRDFRSSLIDVISACDASGDTSTPYYERFLVALENLAVDRGLIDREALDALTSQLVAKRAAEDAARAAADAEAAGDEAGDANA